MNNILNWVDASKQEPPDGALFLVIEDVDSKGRLGDIHAGFYGDGEYFIGSSTAGDPLQDDQIVTFWASVVWPSGYDKNGIWENQEHNPLTRFVEGEEIFIAEKCVGGVYINPRLPDNFDNTSNETRPASHQKWWNRPFIVTFSVEEWDAHHENRTDEYAEKSKQEWIDKGRLSWMKAYPSGVRYEARCLDGGAWDRSTSWGMFATLEEALSQAGNGKPWGLGTGQRI